VDKLPDHKSPVALGLMRGIKQALDPMNLMNPGRMIRG
jgi:FAD/FMN-containing dehydrogenase